MPVSFFEGTRMSPEDPVVREGAERRFRALAAAVREHERRCRRHGMYPAGPDENLYRRMRELSAETELRAEKVN